MAINELDSLRRMLESDRPLEMTQWEEEFLKSVLERYDDYSKLSDKQKAVVDEILGKNSDHARRWA